MDSNINEYSMIINNICLRMGSLTNPKEVAKLTDEAEAEVKLLASEILQTNPKDGAKIMADLEKKVGQILTNKENLSPEATASLKKIASETHIQYERVIKMAEAEEPGLEKKMTLSELDQIFDWVHKNQATIFKDHKPGDLVKVHKNGENKLPRSIAVEMPEKGKEFESCYVFFKKKRVDSEKKMFKTEIAHTGSSKEKKAAAQLSPKGPKEVAEINLQRKFRGTEDQDLFEKEARLLQRCEDCPNVVQWLDNINEPIDRGGITIDTLHSILTVHYTGGKLEDAKDKLTEKQKIRAIGQILDGTVAIHNKNIVHSDLKEGNIFLDKDGNAYVGDFDLAYELGGDDGWIGGSPLYQAPETYQASLDALRGDFTAHGSLGKEIDAFSIGVIMMHMLYGVELTDEPSTICEAMHKILEGTELHEEEIKILREKGILSESGKDFKSEINLFLDHNPNFVMELYANEFKKSFATLNGPLAPFVKALLNPNPNKRLSTEKASLLWKKVSH